MAEPSVPEPNAVPSGTARTATEYAKSIELQYETIFDREASAKMTNVIDSIALHQAKTFGPIEEDLRPELALWSYKDLVGKDWRLPPSWEALRRHER